DAAAEKKATTREEKGTAARKSYANFKHATHKWTKAERDRYTGEDVKSKLVHEVRYALKQISKSERDHLNAELKRRTEEHERRGRDINSKTVLIIDATPGHENKTMRDLLATAKMKGAIVLYAHELRLPDVQQKIEQAKREQAELLKTEEK